jgi:dolichyl-phosphate-mannose--protein O-mannosyl transferase
MISTTDTVIVRLGGEGGAVTLYGRHSANNAWEFRRYSSDSSWSMLDDEVDATPMPLVEPVWVSSWGDGITLLDKYRWA